jgi:hypothetical protein
VTVIVTWLNLFVRLSEIAVCRTPTCDKCDEGVDFLGSEWLKVARAAFAIVIAWHAEILSAAYDYPAHSLVTDEG